MRNRVIALLALLAFLSLQPTESRADESGPACVVDGKTLVINGKRLRMSCRGGVEFTLNGIVTPPLDQLCDVADGRKWYCGRASATMLLEYVKDRTVDCLGDRETKNGPLVGICFVNGESVNGKMVREGWALADRNRGKAYIDLENKAHAERKGLWQGGVVPPW